MDRFVSLVAGLSKLCGIFAVGLIVASIFIICETIFVRYVLGWSVIWQNEFVTYSLVAATFIGSPYVLLTRGHVNVDLVPLYLGHRARVWLALFASALALLFCLVVLWNGIGWWWEAWSKNWRTDTIWRLQLWIPFLSLPIGFGVLCLQYVADILALATGRAMPFGMQPDERP